MNVAHVSFFFLLSLFCLSHGIPVSYDGCVTCRNNDGASGHSCEGSIRFARESVVVDTVTAEVDEIRNARSRFGYVSTVTVQGNCCWRISSQRNHNGQSWTYRSGTVDSIVEMRVKSVRKITCQASA